MYIIAIVLMAIGFASESKAAGFGAPSSIKGCGPEASFNLSDAINDSDRAMSSSHSENISINFGLKWTFGGKKACSEANAQARDLHARSVRQQDAAARSAEAASLQSEIAALTKKIEFCTALPYTLSTAPQSVLNVCSEFLPK